MAQLSARLLRMGWSDFIAAHVPGLRVALVVGAAAYPVAIASRAWIALPDAAVIMLTTGATALIVVSAVRYGPERMLGADGQWFIQRLTTFVAKRARRRARPAPDGPASSREESTTHRRALVEGVRQ
jgi:hypothetical protein